MGAPNQRCGFCGCAIGRSGNTDWDPVTMFNGTACCSQCASRERDKAKRASSSSGGSSGGGAAVGAVGGAALGVGLGIAGGVTKGIGKGLVGLGKLYYKGGKLAVGKTAEYNAKLAAEAQPR